MKLEYVNAFVQGAQSILNTVCGSPGTMGKLFAKQAPYSGLAFSVVTNFTGMLSGKVIYTMDTECGLFLASKVMMGMAVTAMDDMAKSAISELTNMISGSTAGNLYSQDVKVSVTAPAFIDNAAAGDSQFDFVKPGSKLLCIPLHLEDGQSSLLFEIDLHLEG